MKDKNLLVWTVFTLLLALVLVPAPAAARPIRTEFTGTEVPMGPPLDFGVWKELPNDRVHVRGMVSQNQEVVSDPRMSGVNTVVMNANWGPDGAGPIWGTNVNMIPDSADCPGGGAWRGTWTGSTNSDGSYAYRAVSKGQSGCVAGLHAVLYAVNPGDGTPTSYSGVMRDPHGE